MKTHHQNHLIHHRDRFARVRCEPILRVILLFAGLPACASPGMPWETPFDHVVRLATAPFSFALVILAMFGCVFGWVLDDYRRRRLLAVAAVLLVIGATQFVVAKLYLPRITW